MFQDDEIAFGKEHKELGPAYLAARKTAERFMLGFEAEHFRPLIDRFADQLRDRMWTDVCAWMLSDMENNLQGEMYGFADSTLQHLLAGDEWAIDRFLLRDRYDLKQVRSAIAKLVPAELQDARVADLEKEVEHLKQQLEWARR